MPPIELDSVFLSFLRIWRHLFNTLKKIEATKIRIGFFSSLKIYVCHTCQRVVELRRCLQNFWEQKNWRDKSHVTIHQYIIALSSISHLFSVCHVKWLKMRNSIHLVIYSVLNLMLGSVYIWVSVIIDVIIFMKFIWSL